MTHRLSILPLLLLATVGQAADVVIGAGRGFLRIEDGLSALKAGDTLLIYPRSDGKPYEQVAIRITEPDITVRSAPGTTVALDGTGKLYTGTGAVPRAIIEFAPDAHGGRVENLQLTNARNREGNAAGVRIDAADNVTIVNCVISGNDMGIMSNGSHDRMRGLVIRDCHIHGNGAPDGRGSSHNCDLGGADARLIGCRIEGSVDGHNLKSRTRSLLVEGCIIRHSANRECDVVDAEGVTDRPGGIVLFVGCVIVKDPECAGDRGVIHVGQDAGGDRAGTCWLVHCTIIHPFANAVVELSAPGADVALLNTVVADPTGGGHGRALVQRIGTGSPTPTFLGGCWLPYGHDVPPTAKEVTVGAFNAHPPLRDPAGDWRLAPTAEAPFRGGGLDLAAAPLPVATLDADHPLRQRPPVLPEPQLGGGSRERQTKAPTDLGAFEWTPDP